MIDIEIVLVKFLVQRAKMNKPLTCSDRLDFVNSLIRDSPIANVLKEFKNQRCLFDGRDVSKD